MHFGPSGSLGWQFINGGVVLLTPNSHGVFNRCGLSARSALETDEWKELFRFLEQEQEGFLAREEDFRSPDYEWNRDPLHTWSRVWEYPYVYYHLRKWRQQAPQAALPRVADVGSGVTFFPFAVASLGCHVTCTDVDRVLERDLPRVAKVVSARPGMVDHRITDGFRLPFEDGELDAVYCVSVIEHVPHFDVFLTEIARVLKRNGLLVLTFDIDLLGNYQLGVENHRKLSALLDKHFEYLFPETTVHPSDLLTSESGPYSKRFPRGVSLVGFVAKQWLVKPFFGRKPIPLRKLTRLAVQGAVLTRMQQRVA